ncbi:P-type conjugative transfer protein TrbG, partial [Agrobacterium sp. S2]|nr:P-type conjugative transfer protein TrbG [Agrobacterium sp. S2]
MLTAGAVISVALAFVVTAPPNAIAADRVTPNEAKGIGLSGQWRGSRGLVTKGADGKVIFLFGEVQPSVVCSPLQVCDIELQGGEVVRDV